jgi:hypothetical protein
MILKSNESIRLIVVEASASTSSEQGQVGGGRGKMMVVEGKEERWRRCHRVELIYPLHGNDIILLHFTRKMLLNPSCASATYPHDLMYIPCCTFSDTTHIYFVLSFLLEVVRLKM